MITFEQFQASKEFHDDLTEFTYNEDTVTSGYVYEGGCYIETDGTSGYSLVISIDEYHSDDLAELEKILYDEWYVPEHS